MEAYQYFQNSVQQLSKIYNPKEAEEIMYWVYEDVLLIKKAHLKLFSKELGFSEELKLNSLLDRLMTGEPIQYVLGYAYFLDMVFKVNAHTLIPRPETEELVNWVLENIENHWRGKEESLCILDICTGSGCIALALKKKLPEAELFALDVSEEALDMVKWNSKHLNLKLDTRNIDILTATGQEQLSKHSAQIWVCNPPYIPLSEKPEMHPNVLEHEPHLALFVTDEDPLLFYRIVVKAFEASEKAKELFFEISEFQQKNLEELFADRGLVYEFKNDLQGKPRMVHISKIPENQFG